MAKGGSNKQTRIRAAIHRPGIELAERVARFETPFQYLKTARGGFDPVRRFLLDRTLKHDREALAARDDIMAFMRSIRLGEPVTEKRDLEREFHTAHEDEILKFERKYYPWKLPPIELGAPSEPDPNMDEMLDFYICDGLKDYGFDRKNRKARKSSWRCHTSILPRRVIIEFDKGSYLPSTVMSGALIVEDFSYNVALGDPFFYSGSVFYTYRAADPAKQMKLFFDEYHRIFPHVIDALSRGIAAASGK